MVGAVHEPASIRAHSHETPACIMAAHLRVLVGRTPDMAIATRGPVAACAVNGAAQATLDRFPYWWSPIVCPTANRIASPINGSTNSNSSHHHQVERSAGRHSGCSRCVRAPSMSPPPPSRRRASRIRPDRQQMIAPAPSPMVPSSDEVVAAAAALGCSQPWSRRASTALPTPPRCSTRWNAGVPGLT